MPEFTAVLNITAHGINDAQTDQLVEMMDQHEFWYWDEATMVGEHDGVVITSEAFADTDKNSVKLERFLSDLRAEFDVEHVDMTKKDEDNPQLPNVPTAYVYDIEMKIE